MLCVGGCLGGFAGGGLTPLCEERWKGFELSGLVEVRGVVGDGVVVVGRVSNGVEMKGWKGLRG